MMLGNTTGIEQTLLPAWSRPGATSDRHPLRAGDLSTSRDALSVTGEIGMGEIATRCLGRR